MVWLLFHYNHQPLQLGRHGESKYFGLVRKQMGWQSFFAGKWRNSTSYPQVRTVTVSSGGQLSGWNGLTAATIVFSG